MGTGRRRIGWIVGLVLVAGVAGLMLSSFVRSMTYPIPPVPVPEEPPAPLEAVELEGEDGLELSAWWLPPPDESEVPAPVALMLHGNGENLATMRMAGLFDEFAELGMGVLALDYPGYGRSEGDPSEESLLAAADVAWTKLVDRTDGETDERPPRLVIGWSLGAAVGIQIAARHPESVDGLVLISAWSTLVDTARQHFPGFLTDRLLEDRYDSLAWASEIECPVLQIHGSVDRIIPIELGRRLHEELPEPKRWVVVEGAGHNDLLGRPEVWRAMDDFLGSLPG